MAVQNGRKKIALGPKPGEKVRSGVVAPQREREDEGGTGDGFSHVGVGDTGDQSGLVDLDSDG